LPVSFYHNHPGNIRTCSSLKNRKISNIQRQINTEIDLGKSVLDSVENTIIHENINIVASKGKKQFYNTGYEHAKRNNLLRPQIPSLKRDKKILENFDDVRICLNDPFNDKHKFAIRPDSEAPSLFIKDNHIDRDFVLCQTPEQRQIMQDSTVLNIDQNDTCTPEGCYRTLTISGKYKGKINFNFDISFALMSLKVSYVMPKTTQNCISCEENCKLLEFFYEKKQVKKNVLFVSAHKEDLKNQHKKWPLASNRTTKSGPKN